YRLLDVSPGATSAEIKAAYHRALLRFHPDKRSPRTQASPNDPDVTRLKDAYTTLASSELRAAYDAQLRRDAHAAAGPRPAQVISLEEFDEEESAGDMWSYACRCGGVYRIGESDMDMGRHLVGCNSCSEVVWVGYELVEDVG
ncbi:hypothetical protein PLICRDRAFT_102082, partial [Plicaturopsis crispa FD-325 SS-3]